MAVFPRTDLPAGKIRTGSSGTPRDVSQKTVATITSYPARIASTSRALESILSQTHKPDTVIVFLALEQFPDREGSLPEELRQLIESKRVQLRWVDNDLMSHKKYYYALQEFQNDLVITFDDDLAYPLDTIERLLESHKESPDAVVAARAHLIRYDGAGKTLPYQQWQLESNALIGQPSMRLLATGGAGALYPAHLFQSFDFDAEDIMQVAPHADDLWLKAVEVALGIPVVLAGPHRPLQYVPGTQEMGLFHQNLEEGGNDVQWHAICEHFQDKYGINIMERIRSWTTENAPFEQEMVINYLASQLEQSRQSEQAAWQEVEAVRNSRTWKAGRIASAPIRALRKLTGHS